MSRLRRNLVPLLLLPPVIFICGKLLLTPVNIVEVYGAGLGVPAGVRMPAAKEYDRGWPWVFMLEYEYLQTSSRSSSVEIREFSGWKLVGDFAVLIAMTATGWLAIFILHRRSGGWLRFSLRGLMAFVTFAAIGCGWWMHHAKQSKHEEDLLDDLMSNHDVSADEVDYFGPQWIRRFVSDENVSIFKRVTAIGVLVHPSASNIGELPAELMNEIRNFVRLRKLSIGTNLVDLRVRLSNPAALERIEEIEFISTADDETLSKLADLPRLKSLELLGCSISDRGMAAIEKCKSLEKLTIIQTEHTTLSRPPVLDRLAEVNLSGIRFDDAAMDYFVRLRSLKVAYISASGMSNQAVRRFAELPNLQFLKLFNAGRISVKTVQFLEQRIPTVSCPTAGFYLDN